MSHYLRENFYITTSGNLRTQALTKVILEVGTVIPLAIRVAAPSDSKRIDVHE
jgi:hypothetical protein